MKFVADCVAAGAQLANSPPHLPDIVAACIQAEATRRAGKLAAAATTTGAGAQALVIGIASLLAVGQWRREARGRRRIKAADACGLALGGLISAIKTFRSSPAPALSEWHPTTSRGAEFPQQRYQDAMFRLLERRRGDLDAALQGFQGTYSAALFKIDFQRDDDHIALSALCGELRQLQLEIEPYIMMKFKDAALNAKFAKFHGHPANGTTDEIGSKIAEIEARLMAVLRPLVRPLSLQDRLTNALTSLRTLLKRGA